MDPNVWGPHLWFFLHSVTFAYPKCPSSEDKKNIKEFFENVHKILPCTSCKNNYKKHLKAIPLTNDILCSQDKLCRWLVDFHNIVNKVTGKPEKSYEECIQFYNNAYNTNGNTINYTYIIVNVLLLLVVIIGGIYLIYNINKNKN